MLQLTQKNKFSSYEIQHLSLMSRDLDGAVATSVVSSADDKADAYMVVAEELRRQMDLPADWDLRKLVKRPVMTLPYGVTRSGMVAQIVEEQPMDYQQAKEIAEVLEQAITSSMPNAMAVRGWFVECSRELCRAGVAPKWTTPVGSVVDQGAQREYLKLGYRTVRLIDRTTQLPCEDKVEGINTQKNNAGIVANVVHSYDAAALQLTVEGLAAEGISSMSFIHDSYGCAAGDMETLERVLREAHVSIYSEDVLTGLYDEWSALAPEASLPEPPALGDLDVEDVLSSVHFFC